MLSSYRRYKVRRFTCWVRKYQGLRALVFEQKRAILAWVGEISSDYALEVKRRLGIVLCFARGLLEEAGILASSVLAFPEKFAALWYLQSLAAMGNCV